MVYHPPRGAVSPHVRPPTTSTSNNNSRSIGWGAAQRTGRRGRADAVGGEGTLAQPTGGRAAGQKGRSVNLGRSQCPHPVLILFIWKLSGNTGGRSPARSQPGQGGGVATRLGGDHAPVPPCQERGPTMLRGRQVSACMHGTLQAPISFSFPPPYPPSQQRDHEGAGVQQHRPGRAAWVLGHGLGPAERPLSSHPIGKGSAKGGRGRKGKG